RYHATPLSRFTQWGIRNMRKLQFVWAIGGLAGCYALSVVAAWAADAPLSDAAVSERAKAIVARMTPAEKAGQLTQFFYFGEGLGPLGGDAKMRQQLEDSVAAGNVGSLALVNDPVVANRMQRAALKSRLKIPLIMGFDVTHGLRTIFPVPLAMAASWDPTVAERAQTVAASEARAVGIHWTFAPMSDITRDPRWGRIVEGPGEDP